MGRTFGAHLGTPSRGARVQESMVGTAFLRPSRSVVSHASMVRVSACGSMLAMMSKRDFHSLPC